MAYDKTRMIANQVFENVDTQHISDADLRAYLEVVADALRIHNEREEYRKGLWKQYGPDDQCRQVKIKAERCMHAFNGTPELQYSADVRDMIASEGWDNINYTIFMVRQVQGEV